MMNNAAKEATVIIPVIQYKQVFKVVRASGFVQEQEIDQIWHRIIRQKSWVDRIPLVLVTKVQRSLGDKDNVRLQHTQCKIATFVWDQVTHKKRVICCDSPLAMAALHLEYEIQSKTPSSMILERIYNKDDVLHPVSPTRT
jgi:hypothetical protein